MKTRLTGTAIATLAVISALALSGGPASAAATSAPVSGGAQVQLALSPEECSSIRQEIAMLQVMVENAQEELRHAPPSHKGAIRRMIRTYMEEIGVLSPQLVGCPPA